MPCCLLLAACRLRPAACCSPLPLIHKLIFSQPKMLSDDLSKAVADFTQATQVHPQYSKAHYRLATGLQKQNKHEGALVVCFCIKIDDLCLKRRLHTNEMMNF